MARQPRRGVDASRGGPAFPLRAQQAAKVIVQDLTDEGALAASAYPRDADQTPHWKPHVNAPEIMKPRVFDHDGGMTYAPGVSPLDDGMGQRVDEEPPFRAIFSACG